MKRVLMVAPLVVGLACNADVENGAGFGSGADGGVDVAGSSGPEGPGSDAGSTSGGGDAGQGDTGGTSLGDTGGVGDEGGTPGDDDGGGTDGSSGGASSTGGDAGETTTSGGSTSGEADTGEPLQFDACGFPLDGPWIEIEYNQVGGSPSSPSWSYSDTPGWGAAQWAASNANWPEVWDPFQNINVSNDPIGVVAVVAGSARLQLMLGFEELTGYDYATVCVEGRSVSATASVQFDAYNPLTGLGNSGMMAHDWSMHATGLDLGQAFEPGGGVQAVRLEAWGGSGSLGVKRMRLIMHGATY